MQRHTRLLIETWCGVLRVHRLDTLRFENTESIDHLAVLFQSIGLAQRFRRNPQLAYPFLGKTGAHILLSQSNASPHIVLRHVDKLLDGRERFSRSSPRRKRLPRKFICERSTIPLTQLSIQMSKRKLGIRLLRRKLKHPSVYRDRSFQIANMKQNLCLFLMRSDGFRFVSGPQCQLTQQSP